MIDWSLAPEGAVAAAVNLVTYEIVWVRENGGHTGWSLNKWDTDINDDWKTIATRPTQTKTVKDVYEAHPDGWDAVPNRYEGQNTKGEDLVLWDAETESFLQGCDGFCKYTYSKVCTREQLEGYVEKSKVKPKTVKDAVEWSDSKWKAFASDGVAYNHKTKYFSYCDIGDLDEDSWQLVCTREQFEAYVEEQESDKWTHTYENYGQTHKCSLLNEGKTDADGYYSAINDNGLYARPFKVKPIKPTISKAEAWDMCQESHERRVDGLAVISDKIAWVIENHDIT